MTAASRNGRDETKRELPHGLTARRNGKRRDGKKGGAHGNGGRKAASCGLTAASTLISEGLLDPVAD